jgi:aspartate carbamoyltransferase catalytic subunit
MLKTTYRHLLGIQSLSAIEINHLLERAREIYAMRLQVARMASPLKEKTVINLFFENSTRTRTSFEIAARKLGADVINMDVATSAVKKGETLLDTASTLNAMRPSILVVRHSMSGAVHLLSEKVDCSVINAGDGANEHPTQALLDALTIKLMKGQFQGLTVAICGDILHSRVARSNIYLLTKMGATVKVIAPPTLMPSGIETLGVTPHFHMRDGLEGADVVMMLRVQLERIEGQLFPSLQEYFRLYGLDYEKLAFAKPDAIVMHPGPINRGVEIDSALADDISRSVIAQQVEMGVAVRIACLEALANYQKPVIKPSVLR